MAGIDRRNAGIIAAAVAAIVGLGLFALSLARARTSAPAIAAAAAPSETPAPPPPAWAINLPKTADGTTAPVPAPPKPAPVRPARRTAQESARQRPAPAAPQPIERRPPSRAVPVHPPVENAGAPLPPAEPPPPLDATIYTRQNVEVAPPVPILPQTLGTLPPGTRREDYYMIEIVLDHQGNVESAKAAELPRSLGETAVVTMSLSAVKTWHFQPAAKDGRPVRYRQLIPVSMR